MSEALETFDVFQSICISACLIITIPLACFVYYKLIFFHQFSGSYTFKLIVVNGIIELTNAVCYLFLYQLTNYPFMYGFYATIRRLSPYPAILNTLTGGLSLHTSLFIALNRMKTMLFLHKQTNDFFFFIVSLTLSLLLSIPTVYDFAFASLVEYVETPFGNNTAFLPEATVSTYIPRTIADIIRITVSLATLAVNMYLSFLLTKERQYVDAADRQKFNGEKGLVITSIVSYIFYMLYFINNSVARYFDVLFCGYAQWFFLGLNSITPFWCLLLFTPSVRRVAFRRKKELMVITAIHSQTLT